MANSHRTKPSGVKRQAIPLRLAPNDSRKMDIHKIYLETRPEEIAYIQAVLESYEGVGIIRTVERKKAVIVILVVDDLLSVARSILDSLKHEARMTEIPRPADIGADWLMEELATDAQCKMQNAK